MLEPDSVRRPPSDPLFFFYVSLPLVRPGEEWAWWPLKPTEEAAGCLALGSLGSDGE